MCPAHLDFHYKKEAVGGQMGGVMQVFAYCSVILLLSEEKKVDIGNAKEGTDRASIMGDLNIL